MTGGAIDIQRAIVARISGSLYDFGRRVDAFQEYLDYGSLALDVSIIGSPISWIPDVVNASISTIRGDYFGAGLSAAAILPAVGAPGNLTRIGIREAHHVLPKFLGGLDPQKLANLTPEAHGAFHRILRARLQAHGFDLPIGGTTKSSLEWQRYFRANAGAQSTAFFAVLEASRLTDQAFGSSLVRDFG